VFFNPVRPAFRWNAIAFAVAAPLLAMGCGIKSVPLPPVIRIADPTRDLTVFQEDRQAILSWSYPSSTTSGESLHDLESVELWRATVLEVEAPVPGEDARDRELNRQLLLSTGERIAVLDRTGLDAATRGSKLEWYDNLDVWRRDNPSEEPQMIWYGVRSVCCRGRESGLSNIARIVPTVPPAPPTDLVLDGEADGIRLSWNPHDGIPVIVERSSDAELWRAATSRPLSTGEWLDRSAGQGQAWNYRLRSVQKGENGPRIVGEPSAPVGLYYPDIYPPAAPDDLVCLPEGQRVRLRWRPVAKADSYRVSRGAEGAPSRLLAADIKAIQYEDNAPPPGTSIYSVTAVDLAGNESEASTCTAARGSVP
jgi:hypothetical protein